MVRPWPPILFTYPTKGNLGSRRRSLRENGHPNRRRPFPIPSPYFAPEPSQPTNDSSQMCDTAGTLCKAATTVKDHGAASVLAICTHGILSGNAIENLNACEALSKVVVTNTVPLQGKERMCEKIVTINIAPTLSEAIRRTHNGESVRLAREAR
ncbi:MAG: hypothetical protein Q9164_001499 [Protoblastenia rupestris]